MRFDLPFFESISSNLKEKEGAFHRLVATAVHRQLRGKRLVRLLDVGAGVGRVYSSRAWAKMSGRHQVIVDAVEPHPFGISRLRRSRRTAATLRVVPLKFEEWKAPRRAIYDVILCAHVFYHFDRSVWPSVIRNLISRLNRGGITLVVATSRKSEVYRWAHRVLGNDSDPAGSIAFGNFIFAEDVEDQLRIMGVEFASCSTSARVYIAEEKGVNSPVRDQVSRFLAFMYRTKPEQVEQRMDWSDLAALRRHEGRLYVQGADKVIIFGKSPRSLARYMADWES